MAKMIDGPTADDYDQWIDTGSGPGWAPRRPREVDQLDRFTDAARAIMGPRVIVENGVPIVPVTVAELIADDIDDAAAPELSEMWPD